MSNVLAILNSAALFFGAIAMISTVVPAIVRGIAAWRTEPARKLQIEVCDHVFVIDTQIATPRNNREIEGAIEAIREANRITT